VAVSVFVCTLLVLSGVLYTSSNNLAYGTSPPSWEVAQDFVPSGVGQLDGIACPSITNCFGIAGESSTKDTVVSTSDAGSSWSVEDLPNSLPPMNAISCVVATTDCVAVGDDGETITTTDGSTWTQAGSAGTSPLYGVSCGSSTSCVAVGSATIGGGSSAADYSVNGGSTWASGSVPDSVSQLFGVSCISTTVCEADGNDASGQGIILGTTDGGATWSTQQTSTADTGLYGISCSLSNTTCIAVGNGGPGQILESDDEGSSWFEATGPSVSATLRGVACASSTCVAVGYTSSQGVAYSSADGGANWQTSTLPDSGSELWSVSCPSDSNCATGSLDSSQADVYLMFTTDAAENWSSQLFGPGWTGVTSVSCATASFCASTAYSNETSLYAVIVVNDDTVTVWAAPITTKVDHVTCTSSSDCIATGFNVDTTTDLDYDAIYVSTDGGITWGQASSPSMEGETGQVTCPSVSDCMTVVSGNPTPSTLVTTNGGLSWTSESVPNPDPSEQEVLTSISCWSTNDCTAIGDELTDTYPIDFVLTTTDFGQMWTITPESNLPLNSIDCISDQCVAVGANGGASYSNSNNGGITWSPAQTLPNTGAFESVSCSSLSSCTAVAQTNSSGIPGNNFIFGSSDLGGPWTPEIAPSNVTGLNSVACVTGGICEAGGEGSSKDALILAGPSLTPQTITFTSTAPSNAIVEGPSYTVSATGGGSGNPVTFTIDPTASSVCSISGSVVSFVGGGTCEVDANQAGNSTYAAAQQAQQSFHVAKAREIPKITSFTPAKGVVGTKVTIDGSNLLGATRVKFNGTAAKILRDTATEITTKVPVGATTGKITVKTSPGGTATSTRSFRVT
jgi:photosystem II stability/assembly factor-like uncharacterized protein